MTREQEQKLLQNYIRKNYFYSDTLEEINKRNFGEKTKYKGEN